MRLRQGRGLVALAAVSLLGASPGRATAAAPPVEVENLRVGFASRRRTTCSRSGRGRRSGSSSGRGTSGSRGHGGGRPRRRRDADRVPPGRSMSRAGQSQRFTSYARPGTRDPDSRSGSSTGGGRRAADVGTSLAAARRRSGRMRPCCLTLGQPQWGRAAPDLPGFGRSDQNKPGGPELSVARFDSLGDAIPGRWYGYDAAGPSCSTPTTARSWPRWPLRAARPWSTGSGAAGTWSSPSAATGRRCATACSAPILPAVPTGQERVAATSRRSTRSRARSKPIRPAGRRR